MYVYYNLGLMKSIKTQSVFREQREYLRREV